MTHAKADILKHYLTAIDITWMMVITWSDIIPRTYYTQADKVLSSILQFLINTYKNDIIIHYLNKF